MLIKNVRRNVARRTNEARETERWLVNRFTHEKGDGRFSHEFAATLEEVPTKQLVDYLAYVSDIGDRDRVHWDRLAFATRVDRDDIVTA